MENILVQLIKYGMILLMLIYTYHAYAALRIKEADRLKKRLVQMTTLFFLQHFLGYLSLFIQVNSSKYVFLYLGELAVFVVVFVLYYRLYPRMSKLMFLNCMQLISIGLLFLTRLTYDKAVRQLLFITIGFLIGAVIPWIIQKLEIRNYGWLYGCVGILLLICVLVLGVAENGATNWLGVGGFIFQPSEFVKILFILCIAASYQKNHSFHQIVAVSVMAAANVLILVFSKDLGGALIFFVTYIMLLYIASGNVFYMIAGFGAGSIASVVAYRLFHHVQVRVMAWKSPFQYIDKEGFQMSQSLFAIGTGGWFGMGINKGLPTSIPIVESDFIFSAIAEELGGVYAIAIIFLYINLFMGLMQYGMRIRDSFYRLVVIGIAVLITFQAFLSIGGVIKFIPSTGVTLPFISYGGSSMMACIFLLMIYEGIYLKTGKRKNA